MAMALVATDGGLPMTVVVCLLGLFLYPDQPVLTATVFDRVGREVAGTGLGVVSSAGAFLAAASPLVDGSIYDARGFDTALYFISSLFVVAAIAFLLLPVSKQRDA